MIPPYTTGGALPSLTQDHYWAACPTEDLPQTVLAKALRYYDRVRRDGRVDLWRRGERTYYGQDTEGGMANSAAVTFGGKDGENVMIRDNHWASIVRGLLATAVSKRPQYEPRASNTDAESAQQVTVARSLLEFYSRNCDLEGVRIETARLGVCFGEGYTALRWNAYIGDEVGVIDENGQPVMPDPNQPLPEGVRIAREGDVEVQSLTPLEVIRDLDSTRRELEWVICAYRENVWTLASRYPQKRDEILALRGSPRWNRSAWVDSPWERTRAENEQDIITVWWLYHLPSDALPQGRMAQCLTGNVVLEDRAFDLEALPVVPLWPEREMTLSRGHTGMFDLLALQEAYDAAVDALLTQVDAHGVPNVTVPKGGDISPEQIAGNVHLIPYEVNPDAPNAGRPEVLNLLDVSPSLVGAIQFIKGEMETLSAINSVIRGDPMPQLKSGAALALVQSLAVAFNTALQSAVVRHDEHVATRLIQMLKRYATNERQVEIVGRAQKGALATWSADSLSTIERVVVEVGSPLQEHTAGKLELAQQLLAAKLITTPQEYIEVITTGRLEPMYRGPKCELDLIARENEDLAMGKPCPVSTFDDHAMHVGEHKAVSCEANVRANPQLMNVIAEHIEQHELAWQNLGGPLSTLTKQSVPAPMIPLNALKQGAPPGPQGHPPAPPGNPATAAAHPPAGGPQPPHPNPHKAQPMGHAPPQGGPMLPTNPLTGQSAPNPAAT